jgi:hypothetical protein
MKFTTIMDQSKKKIQILIVPKQSFVNFNTHSSFKRKKDKTLEKATRVYDRNS